MHNLRLLFLATIAFAIPTLAATNPEFMLASPNYSSAPGRQSAPSLASDGTSYFAVWEDTRPSGSHTIVGSRVAADGRPIDPAGIVFPTGEGVSNPRVVFAGGNYLVVWQSAVEGLGLARVSPEGVVLDATAKYPIPGWPSHVTGAIATDGTNTAILWQLNGTHASILDANGNATQDVTLPPLALEEYERGLAVAWNGSKFVITRVIGRNSCSPCPVMLARIYILTSDGELSAGVSTAPVLHDGWFSMTALPDRILIASATWISGFSGFNAWMFDNSGAQIGGTIGWNGPTQGDPVSVATDGDSFVLAWAERVNDRSRVVVRRIDRDGSTPPDPVVVASSSKFMGNAKIARDAHGEFVVAWCMIVVGNGAFDFDDLGDMLARPLSASLRPSGDERLVTLSAAAEDHPSIGWNGSEWLVAWYEHEGSNGERLVVMRRARDGASIDRVPVDVTAPAMRPSFEPRDVSIASDGRDFLIAWIERPMLLMRRLSGDGVWLDAEPKVISDQAIDFSTRAAAWDGRKYFIVWSREVGIDGAAIDPDGTVGPSTHISPEGSMTFEPVLARLGSGWLIAWTYAAHGDGNSDTDVVAARVGFDGTVLDTAPIEISAPYATYARFPSIASAGDTALVTWATYGALRGLRLASNGIMEGSPDGNGTQLLAASSDRGTSIDTAWDGRDFLIVSSSSDQSANTITLYRLPFADALQPLGNGEEISRGLTYEGAILARPNGGAFIAYPRVVLGAPYGGVSRMFGRTIAARLKAHAIRR